MAGLVKDWGSWLTPDLANNPGAAYDVSKSSNPKDAAYVTSHSIKMVATQDAIDDHINNNGSTPFWDNLGYKALTSAEWFSKPLQEIRRDYKFVHSVYTNHGILAGFAVTLGVAGGAAAGALLGGGIGAALGADIAASSLRKLAGAGPWKDVYKDSVKDSENPLYKVSAGRDFSNLLATSTDAIGLDAAAKTFRQTDAGVGKFISGTGDIGFALTTDPFMVVSKFGTAMRGGKLLILGKAGETQLRYPMYKVIPGAKSFIESHTGRVLTSEQMDSVRMGSTKLFGGNQVARTYNRALEDIAGSTAGEIALKYPRLGTEAAGRLGAIKSADEVHNFLKGALYFGELEGSLAGAATLPSRTLLRATIATTPVAQAIQNSTVQKYIKDAVGNFVENPAWKPLSKIRSTYKTFTGYMPYSVDAETGKLSTTKFRWNAPDSASVIYRIAKFGMGDTNAKEMAGKYAEAIAADDINLARIIKNQTIFETFKAMGLHDDNEFVLKVKSELDKIGQQTIGGQIYGVSPTGEALGTHLTNLGPRLDGIFEHHAQEMFDIPNFNSIKTQLHEAGKLSKVYGKLDDFISDQYTNKIFKPLALATTGFGLRIAASEMIPAVARYGVINTFKAGLGKAAAKANTRLEPSEAKHVMSAALVALGASKGIAPDVMVSGFNAFKDAAKRGMAKAAKYTAPEQLELATRLIITNQGHILKEAIATGHGDLGGNAMETAANYFYQIKKNNSVFKNLPDYTLYQADNPYYLPLLQTSLNKATVNVAEKNIIEDVLKFGKNKFQVSDDIGKTAEHMDYIDVRQKLIDREYSRMMETKAGRYDAYKSESKKLARWQYGDLRQFAETRVDATLGKIVGQDGTIQRGLAKKITSGTQISLEDIVAIHSTSPLALPKMVEGSIMFTPPSKGYFNAIIDKGFKYIVDPIINNITREPLYMLHVAEEYASYAPRVALGHITEDQALRYAQQRAVYSMIPEIHNVALRSQFSQFARNVLPFYFAQEQAMKRAFNTVKDTSAGNILLSRGLRYYQLTEQGLNNPAFVMKDDKDNRYITFPGVGAFGEAVQNGLAAYGIPLIANLPVSAQGNVISLRTVLPELQPPGTSPFVSISANAVAKFLPFTRGPIKSILGDIAYRPSSFGVDATIDALIPATWAKNVFRALTLDEQDVAVSNAITGALAAAYYHEQLPGQKEGVEPDAVQMQQFNDKIKWNVRSILLLKAGLGLLSPLAPKVTQEDLGFRDEFWSLVKSKGNFGDALFEFLGKNGSSAISYTIARTESTIDGVKYPYVKDTIDFIKTNNDKFKDPKVSTGYYFLIPQKTEKQSSFEVFSEMVSMHLRSTRQPLDLIKQFYIAQGEYAITEERKKHYKALDDAKANFDTYSARVENDKWATTMKDMAKFYPIWYEDYRNPGGQGNAKKAFAQLNAIFANPATAPKHEQALEVKKLLDSYNQHLSQMNTYSSMNINGFLPSQEKQNWEAYLYGLSVTKPELAPVIYGVFNKLGQ